MQYHHRPAEALEFLHMASAIQIADAWVNKHQVGSSGEKLMPAINLEAARLLGIQEYELEEIWMLALDDIKSVVRQFVSH